jgi:SAM-dependent methyltransferase
MERSADGVQVQLPSEAIGWDRVYAEQLNTMWEPNEDIVRFCSRLIRKRRTLSGYVIHRNVERMLDLGCGNGRHAVFFARQGISAYGVDWSAQAIEWAREWARAENLDATFEVADITRLPFPDAWFDVVVSHGVLDHMMPDAAAQAAVEVKRVLKPGGLLYVDLRSSDDGEFGGEEVAPNTFVITCGYEAGLVQHFFSAEDIQSLIEGRFRVLYRDITTEERAEPQQWKYVRWVLALEALAP